MEPATLIAIGQIAQAIAMVGFPAANKIMQQFEKEDGPSLEDIQEITNLMKKPEEYFSARQI